MDFSSGNSKIATDPCIAHIHYTATSFSVLAETWVHQLWRPSRADCNHAPRSGGGKTLDLGKAFFAALNYCMILPGPEAQQLATYIGWLLHRTWGGIIAGVLFILPSFFVLVALAWVYMAYGSIPAVAGMLYGFKPAVVAIVLFAAYGSVTSIENVPSWSIAVLAFVAIFALKAPFPVIVFTAGLIGYFGGRLYPDHFKTSGWARDCSKRIRSLR